MEILLLIAYIYNTLVFVYMLHNTTKYINKLARLVNTIMAYINSHREVPDEVKDDLNEIYLGLADLYELELEDTDE